MKNKIEIIMIGSGNLATNLAKLFYSIGHKIVQVYSRNIDNAKKLSHQLGCEAISNLVNLKKHADLYIIAVSDTAIATILENVDFSDKKVVHTAGSVPLSIFGSNINNCGVFYPLQTFSKERILDFKNVPICIEANNEDFKLFLNHLANQISTKIWSFDSETRKKIHLSAVFVNNFVNHTYSLAEEILKEKNIPFDILSELIKETAAKAIELGPTHSQTGPAIRNDIETQKKHLDLLSSKPEIKQFYEWISNNISLKYNQM
jgi:predicted short-subunit dehydrogenase-like oxidoreductase (DUF2520 family)